MRVFVRTPANTDVAHDGFPRELVWKSCLQETDERAAIHATRQGAILIHASVA